MAGLIAGARGMPVTMLKLHKDMRDTGQKKEKKDAKEKDKEETGHRGHGEQSVSKDSLQKELSGAQSHAESTADLKSDPLAREVKAGAKKSAARVIADESEPDPEKVHLTARVPVDSPADVVRDEARKGYDLMFIGLSGSVEDDGSFAPAVTELAAGFEGPLAVFTSSGEETAALTNRSRILVPVNGSPPSRRAAEAAFALARATGAKIQVLFVSQTGGHKRTRRREEQVLKDMSELGERYDVTAATRISARSAAAPAILKEAGRGYAMIVMGVSARPGEELFFGNTATAVLQGWKNSLLLIAS
jgi:nucleotide-binding universal stress UspA family protein